MRDKGLDPENDKPTRIPWPAPKCVSIVEAFSARATMRLPCKGGAEEPLLVDLVDRVVAVAAEEVVRRSSRAGRRRRARAAAGLERALAT
jgi:hypothetical protein